MYDSISKLLELTALSGCVSTSNLKSSLFAGLCFADQPSTIAPKTNTINQLLSTRNDEDEAIAKPGNCKGSEIPQGDEFHQVTGLLQYNSCHQLQSL